MFPWIIPAHAYMMYWAFVAVPLQPLLLPAPKTPEQRRKELKVVEGGVTN